MPNYATFSLGKAQVGKDKGRIDQRYQRLQISGDLFVCLFVFVALRPKSTAMVIGGRSVHLTTLFPGQA